MSSKVGQMRLLVSMATDRVTVGKTASSHILGRGRTGLVVRASDSGTGDPSSILSRVGVLFP